MTSFTAIKEAIDDQAEAFEAFKQTNDQRLAEIAAKAAAAIDRVEELEANRSTPRRQSASNLSRRDRDHIDLFSSYLRNPSDASRKTALLNFEAAEFKDVTIGSGPGGGVAVPEIISRDIERLEKKFSPVRDLVKVQPTATSDYKELVNIRGTTATWVGESGMRSATLTSQLREVTPTHGELYAYPQASNWSLDDIFFDVGAWIAEECAQQFAIAEGAAVISGDGSNKPTGMLKTTPVSTADFASPLRAAEAYQYIASDLTPGGSGILADTLIDLSFVLNSIYRSNATWVMNSVTAAAIRKLKDGNDQYLWVAGLQAGQPDMLLGRPVRYWEQMPDIGSNNFPVAFGDFRRGYTMTDRHSTRIIKDEVTTPGYTKFYVRRRVGGKPTNNDAVKFLRTL